MKHTRGATCPVEKVARILSDSWTMLIVRDLMVGKKRFSDLATSLSPISTRTLTLKLKQLSEDGIVVKDEPYYSLTSKGKNLASIYKEMTVYGKKYLV